MKTGKLQAFRESQNWLRSGKSCMIVRKRQDQPYRLGKPPQSRKLWIPVHAPVRNNSFSPVSNIFFIKVVARRTQTQILQFVETQMPGQQVDQQRIAHSLQELVEKRLLLHIQDKYLALASYPPVRPMENVFTVGSNHLEKRSEKSFKTGSVFQSIKI